MPRDLDYEIEEEPRKVRYDLVGLNRNPFHSDPDPPDQPEVFAEYRKVWSKINSKIGLVRNRGYNQNLILFADYGLGKSHIIKFLRSKINSDRQSVAFTANVPQSLRFSDLYKALVTSVDKSLIMEKMGSSKSTALRGRLGKDVESALRHLIKSDTSDLAWRWLSGSATYSHERFKISVKNKLERDDEICLSALVALFEALVKSGVELIFLGIDEVETAKTRFASETRATEKLLELFRRLVDEVESNIFFLLAATEEWLKVWMRFGPLVSRFPSYDIEKLVAISKIEEYKLFVLEYLESERVDGDRIWSEIRLTHGGKTSSMTVDELKEANVPGNEIRKRSQAKGPMNEYLLFPFTNDGIAELFEVTGGSPRNIVIASHFLIEKAVEQARDISSVNPIDRNLVLKHKQKIAPLLV